jgi:hypothetical protein
LTDILEIHARVEAKAPTRCLIPFFPNAVFFEYRFSQIPPLPDTAIDTPAERIPSKPSLNFAFSVYRG